MGDSQVIARRYRLLDRLGAGGMSVVWRAHDDVLDREVAVKVLSPHLAADPELLARIQIEARAAARLHHPHVVEVHDYGETDQSLPYVVMELVDGRSLADLLTGGALPWRVGVLIGAQVAAALSAAHARGIVHRDVKPSNVMVTSDGVKLVDFGISATVGEADGTGGEVLGTPAYLAPERLSGGPVRPATDVYALGLLLYLTLAGHLPWEASTTTQMLKAHAYLEPDRLPPIHDLPPEVAELCHRCLAKDPAERPDAGEVASVLADAAGVVTPPPLLPTTVGVAVPPPTTAIVRAPSRRRRLIAAIAAAVLALAGLGVWLGSRSGPPPTAQAMDQAPAASLRCSVRYAVSSALNGRFRTAVTVRNTGARAAGRWRLSFTLPDGQRLVGGTGWQQVGRSAHVGGTALAPGAIASTGFDASYSDAAALPSEFRLNGTVCAAELAVAGQTIGPSSSPAAQIAAGPARPAGAVQVAGPGGAGPGQSEAEPKPKAKPKAKGKPDDKDKGKSGKGKSGKG